MKRDSAEWQRVLTAMGLPSFRAQQWAEPFAEEVQEEKFSKGIFDLIDWLPQILWESGMLSRLEENLSYSTQRLMEVWPGRFPTIASAQPYANNPMALAEKVYGGRMGNNLPGDGWRYRGRGPIQITGKDNYRTTGKLVGQDLVGVPDLAAQPRFALEISIAWWEDKIPDSMLGETTSLRKRVNGGTEGLAQVQALTAKARQVLGASA